MVNKDTYIISTDFGVDTAQAFIHADRQTITDACNWTLYTHATGTASAGNQRRYCVQLLLG